MITFPPRLLRKARFPSEVWMNDNDKNQWFNSLPTRVINGVPIRFSQKGLDEFVNDFKLLEHHQDFTNNLTYFTDEAKNVFTLFENYKVQGVKSNLEGVFVTFQPHLSHVRL